MFLRFAEPQSDVAGIATGRGERALYLVDQDGVLLSRASNSWVTVATDVRDPVFPG